MDDELFPSGEWTGFYNYSPPEKFRMDLALEFSNGSMSGQGCDTIAPFLIKGRYDTATRECYFTKSYIGAHSVYYKGFREGKGIWGTWEIGPFSSGGFHIWPRKSGDGDTEKLEEELTQPTEAIGTEQPQVELIRPARVTLACLQRRKYLHFPQRSEPGLTIKPVFFSYHVHFQDGNW